MTCIELQESLAENDKGNSPAQRAHLKDCPHCAALVSDLLVIACAAGELRAEYEPSPRVWKSIESALKREGLIRPQASRFSLLPSLGSGWSWSRWALPVAAALLITIGVLVRQHAPSKNSSGDQYVSQRATPDSASDLAIAGLNDDDLMQEVSQQSPTLQQQYTDSLRRVNQYIVDAKSTVDANPDDEEARRSLMEAYQQKAMLFELALERSLP